MYVSCRTLYDHNHAVVKARGAINSVADCIYVSKVLREAFSGVARTATLDMTDVTFMTGSFCGFLVRTINECKQKDRRLAVVTKPHSDVHGTLVTLGMTKLVEVRHTVVSEEKENRFCASA